MKFKTIPLGERVLIEKDEDQNQSKGGIILPENCKIPVSSGTVIEISQRVENDPLEPIHILDKVLVHLENAIPVSNEPENDLFIVNIDDVIAVLEPVEEPRVEYGREERS